MKASLSDVYFSVSTLFPVAFGIFFAYVGWIMPRFKRNWFVGIKTPWTITSDSIWQKTHWLGGKLFLASGLLSLATGLFLPNASFAVFIVSVLVATFVPIVYSYLLWKKEPKTPQI